MTGSITISVFCPICKADIYFAITGDFNEFPVPFQYKHGRPVHNAILTLDKNFQIVDAQFKPLTRRGRPTKAAIDDFMNTLKAQSPADVGKALAKLLTELPAVYDPNLETSEERYQFYGYDLAEKCSTVLDGENDLGLITTMHNVFESSKIGKMSNIKNEGVNTFFEISNPIQNAKVPDGGKCFFVFMKSFFHKLYQQKFQKSYLLRSDWDIMNKTGKFQLICQWNEWAEKLKKRMAAKKK